MARDYLREASAFLTAEPKDPLARASAFLDKTVSELPGRPEEPFYDLPPDDYRPPQIQPRATAGLASPLRVPGRVTFASPDVPEPTQTLERPQPSTLPMGARIALGPYLAPVVEATRIAAPLALQTELGKGVAGGLREQNPAMVGSSIEMAGKGLGSEWVAEKGRALQRVAETGPQEYRPRIADWSEIKGPRDAIDWTLYGVGQAIASTVPVMAGGAVGATAGSLLGPLGTQIGGIAGAVLPSYSLNAGSLYEELKGEGVDSPALAAIVALPVSALDALGALNLIKPFTDQAKKQIVKSVVRRVAKAAGKGFVTEGGTEGLQEAIQDVTVSLKTGRPLDPSRWGQAAVIGGLTGMVLGAPGGAVEGGPSEAVRQPVPPRAMPAQEAQEGAGRTISPAPTPEPAPAPERAVLGPKVPPEPPSTPAPVEQANPYLRMPIERVQQDADRGVKLAQEALEQREAEVEPAPQVTPEVTGKSTWFSRVPEVPVGALPKIAKRTGGKIEYGIARQETGFEITTEQGARIVGYLKNHDFPGQPSKETRGELFYAEVPESEQRKGLGTKLVLDALDLLENAGSTTVNMSTTSESGKALVGKLLRSGAISGPIQKSETGKTEYYIGPEPAEAPKKVAQVTYQITDRGMVEVSFPERPNRDVLLSLKQAGFRKKPNETVWRARKGEAAETLARELSGATEAKAEPVEAPQKAVPEPEKPPEKAAPAELTDAQKAKIKTFWDLSAKMHAAPPAEKAILRKSVMALQKQLVDQGVTVGQINAEGQRAEPVPQEPEAPAAPEAKTGRKRVAHFTLPENASKILAEGYDTSKPPVHGTGAKEGGAKTGKAGGDILYFTTDEGRWSTAQVYVGPGKGTISRDVYDYDKQAWVKEEKAYKKVNLGKVEADIRENAKSLTIDSYDAAEAFLGKAPPRFEFIEALIGKAKTKGYDIVNVSNPGGSAWESVKRGTTNYGDKNWYDELTGNSGNDDYFVLNRDALLFVGQEKPTEAPAEPSAPAKEPWEMTRGEFVEWSAEETGLKPESRSGAEVGTRKEVWERGHRTLVQKALREQNPVPPEVLADYPDLQAKAKPAPEPKAAVPTEAETLEKFLRKNPIDPTNLGGELRDTSHKKHLLPLYGGKRPILSKTKGRGYDDVFQTLQEEGLDKVFGITGADDLVRALTDKARLKSGPVESVKDVADEEAEQARSAEAATIEAAYRRGLEDAKADREIDYNRIKKIVEATGVSANDILSAYEDGYNSWGPDASFEPEKMELRTETTEAGKQTLIPGAEKRTVPKTAKKATAQAGIEGTPIGDQKKDAAIREDKKGAEQGDMFKAEPRKPSAGAVKFADLSLVEVIDRLKRKEIKPSKYAFQDKEIEARHLKNQGVTPPSPMETVSDWLDKAWRNINREYEHLPKTGEFVKLRTALTRLKKQKGVSSYDAVEALTEVRKDMSPDDFDLFARKVFLADQTYEVSEKRILANGWTPGLVESESKRIDAFVDGNESVQKALSARKKMWDSLLADYIQAMKDIGFNVEDRFKNPAYFRHQVLEYVNAKGLYGAGKKLKAPTGRGFLKQRIGGSFDINTDYLQAEYEVLAQMLYDIEVAKTIKLVDDEYNIHRELKQKAKKRNESAMMELFRQEAAGHEPTKSDLKRVEETGLPIEEVIAGRLFRTALNQQTAIGFSRLKKIGIAGELPNTSDDRWGHVIEAINEAQEQEVATKADAEAMGITEGGVGPSVYIGFDDEVYADLWPYLAWILKEHPKTPAGRAAAAIFGGISGKKKTIQKTLEQLGTYTTWKSLMFDPEYEGYTVWQPREGNVFYFAYSVPEQLATRLLEGGTEAMGLTKDQIGQVMAVGGRRKEFVVKGEIAATLDALYQDKPENPVGALLRHPMRWWKINALVGPRRILKYNLRNLTGDADALFAGNPSAFKKTPRAAQELWTAMLRDGAMTSELREYFKRGGFGATLQVQEMGDIGELAPFRDLKKEYGSLASIPVRAWKKTWGAARLGTDFRESILRYAAYLDYLEQMQKNKSGLPDNYGASIREEIQALDDVRDRAFRLSNDLLGAYDEIGVAGQWLRDHAIPFWSWNEVNARRYKRLLQNAVQDGKRMAFLGRKLAGGAAFKSPYIAYRVGRFAIKAAGLWAILTVWNQTLFPDEEDDLPEDVKARPHITFGRDREGRVLYFSRLGALADFLDWFGLDAGPLYVQDWLNGRRTVNEIATEMAKAAPNKLVNAINPIGVKGMMEIVTRRQLYPDAFRPRLIRDRGQYIAQTLGVVPEYQTLFNRPSKPWIESLPDFVVYRADPLQVGYWELVEEQGRFLKRKGKSAEGFHLSPRSNALYNLRLSVRYGDRVARKKFLDEYRIYGGTLQGMRQSFEGMSPLAYMNKEDRKEFVAGLDDRGRRNLSKAISFYTHVLLGDSSIPVSARGAIVEALKKGLDTTGARIAKRQATIDVLSGILDVGGYEDSKDWPELKSHIIWLEARARTQPSEAGVAKAQIRELKEHLGGEKAWREKLRDQWKENQREKGLPLSWDTTKTAPWIAAYNQAVRSQARKLAQERKPRRATLFMEMAR